MTQSTVQAIAGLVFVVVYIAGIIIPFRRIFGRLGFRPALAFLMLFPVVNIVILYWVAFSTPRAGK